MAASTPAQVVAVDPRDQIAQTGFPPDAPPVATLPAGYHQVPALMARARQFVQSPDAPEETRQAVSSHLDRLVDSLSRLDELDRARAYLTQLRAQCAAEKARKIRGNSKRCARARE